MSDNHTQSIDQFDALVKPIEGQMIRAIWRIVRHEHDFDDSFQSALTKIWNQLDVIQRHPNPKACILRICLNVAHDTLRQRARQGHHESDRSVNEAFPDSTRDGAQQLMGEEQHDEILDAISTLPPTQAEAVLLRFIEDFSYTEISQALECTEASARQAVCRGRDKLIPLLEHLRPQISIAKAP